MRAEIIFTGSELLQGRVLNSHAQYLGRRLSENNIEVTLQITVGDDAERLGPIFGQALARADLVLITGGLGPTTDDLTKETVARVLGLSMVLDEKSLSGIKEFFERRGMSMPQSNVKQAYLPQGATVLPNRRGTAPGVLIEKGTKMVVLLPGPPHELTAMFEQELLPLLAQRAGAGAVIRDKIIRVTGISESAVQDRLRDLGGQGNPGITYLAQPGQVQVRVTAKAGSAAQAEGMVEALAQKVESCLEGYIFSRGDEVLEQTIGEQLLAKEMFLGVAESCTGGLIAARMTDIPGSSAYFAGGVVAYSNDVKISLLGVAPETIDRYGAVSKQTAVAMAEGVRNLLRLSLGLAVTGIAGPDGATPAKPRGLVYIALASAGGTVWREFHFPGNRLAVRLGTVNAALNMVRNYLQGT